MRARYCVKAIQPMAAKTRRRKRRKKKRPQLQVDERGCLAGAVGRQLATDGWTYPCILEGEWW